MDNQSGQLFGYARASTTDQELNLQIDALLSHGVEKCNLFCDKISGRDSIRCRGSLARDNYERVPIGQAPALRHDVQGVETRSGTQSSSVTPRKPTRPTNSVD